jgi:hypothetical protein
MTNSDLYLNSYPFRRAYERFRIGKPATLVGAGKEEVILNDLSADGACITARTPLAIDQKLNILINPYSAFKKPAIMSARIMWLTRLEKGNWRLGLNFGIEKLPLDDFVRQDPIVEKRPRAQLIKTEKARERPYSIVIPVSLIFLISFLASFSYSEKGIPRRITLRGVTVDTQKNSAALINDKIFVTSDNIASYTVEAIGQDYVVLKSGNKNKVLKLNKSIYVLNKQPL